MLFGTGGSVTVVGRQPGTRCPAPAGPQVARRDAARDGSRPRPCRPAGRPPGSTAARSWPADRRAVRASRSAARSSASGRAACCWTGWRTSPASSWQQRWLASGADAAGGLGGRPAAWLREPRRHSDVAAGPADRRAATWSIGADVHPALARLAFDRRRRSGGSSSATWSASRDPGDSPGSRAVCAGDPASPERRSHDLYRCCGDHRRQRRHARRHHRRRRAGAADAEDAPDAAAPRSRRSTGAPRDGHLRPSSARDLRELCAPRPAHAGGAGRPLPDRLPAGPRPARGLPAGTPAGARLHQPANRSPMPRQAVLVRPRAPSPRHRHPAADRRGRGRLETAAADQDQDEPPPSGRRATAVSERLNYLDSA